MKRKILVVAVTVMMMAMTLASSALPALAQPNYSCDWYYDRYISRVFDQDWWELWCQNTDDESWILAAWWSVDSGIIWVA